MTRKANEDLKIVRNHIVYIYRGELGTFRDTADSYPHNSPTVSQDLLFLTSKGGYMSYHRRSTPKKKGRKTKTRATEHESFYKSMTQS